MAKLVLLLVLVCFQFSSQEELGKPENELVKPENELVKEETPEKVPEPLDGADENQLQPDVKPDDDDDDDDDDDLDDWTEEDEKWFQQILELLKESGEDKDEDYEDDSEEFDKLMAELDKYFGNSNEDDDDWFDWDSDEWFKDENWDIDLEHYPDYFDKQEDVNLVVKDDLDLYYSWLYRLQIKKEKSRRRQEYLKRFTSV